MLRNLGKTNIFSVVLLLQKSEIILVVYCSKWLL